MKLVLLGVLGPVQLILGTVVIVGLIALIIVLATTNAKNKSKAKTLNSVLEKKQNSKAINDIERLEKLRQSGALTDAEFESEKTKILNN